MAKGARYAGDSLRSEEGQCSIYVSCRAARLYCTPFKCLQASDGMEIPTAMQIASPNLLAHSSDVAYRSLLHR